MLEAAYDDAEGVTAEFNRNVLHVINRELGADFDPRPSSTSRSSTPSASGSRCACARAARQRVRIAAHRAARSSSPRGEELRTEISAKFTPERLAADLAAAGLQLATC